MNDLTSSSAILLGLAQDAGVPQIACGCDNCLSINSNAGWPACLALVDDLTRQYWIIDATPRFVQQLNWLKLHYPAYHFSGILLTHAHIGHYTGLMYLGREAMASDLLPVYASVSMQAYLSKNGPWSGLVELKNIELHDLHANQQLTLSTSITITPIAVDHRSEFSDTLAMLVSGVEKKLFYCPDIDHWHNLDLAAMLNPGDYALLDATFFSEHELPGRDMDEIPHPLVTQTIKFVKGQAFQAWVIHLNHSNPLWKVGKETQLLRENEVHLPEFGQVWQL